MNYTPNHHMPQWVSSDRIRMDDFNQMSQDIEAGLDAASELPYAVGSYTGSGATQQKISLPFTPSLIIISGMTESTDANSTSNVRYFAMTCDNANVRRRVEILRNGFFVYPAGNYDFQTPDLNEVGRHYDYIAFR